MDNQEEKQPFLGHLEELRKRLIASAIAVGIGFAICYFFSERIFQVLIEPLKAVMHCFSGDEALLREYISSGLYISFTCNVTFAKAHGLREVLKFMPLERLLLETDCPFLAPQAKRGQRNEPAYLTYLVEAIAENTGIGRDEIARVTTENAKRFFNIS